jgi:hypothetical protein
VPLEVSDGIWRRLEALGDIKFEEFLAHASRGFRGKRSRAQVIAIAASLIAARACGLRHDEAVGRAIQVLRLSG